MRTLTRVFYSLFACLLCAMHSASSYAIEVEISPDPALIDQPLSCIVRGIKPGQKVKLTASSYDDAGVEWKSWAEFTADENGDVHLDKQAPTQGTYSGVDGMGLFWSMQPAYDALCYPFITDKTSIPFFVDAYVNDECMSHFASCRNKLSAEVRRFPIKKDGIVGILFLPPSKKPLPTVIVLNGSRAGLNENIAQVLASRGFATLALGYFGLNGLPEKLENIPMEYFEKTIKWLQSRKEIDGKHIGIYGASRGAELALILGSLFPDTLKGIVAVSPSSVIYPGLSATSSSAWTYHGQPVGPAAIVQMSGCETNTGQTPDQAIVQCDKFLFGMQMHPDEFVAAAIPVEKIKCPLLLISGGDDKMWPSTLFAQHIQARLARLNRSTSCQVLIYPLAGHQIGLPFIPTIGSTHYHIADTWFALGGNFRENAAASQDSWKKIVHFFESTLRSTGR